MDFPYDWHLLSPTSKVLKPLLFDAFLKQKVIVSWFLYRKKSTSSSSKTFLCHTSGNELCQLFPRFAAIRRKIKMSILFCISSIGSFGILLGRSRHDNLLSLSLWFLIDSERYQREHLEILPTSLTQTRHA